MSGADLRDIHFLEVPAGSEEGARLVRELLSEVNRTVGIPHIFPASELKFIRRPPPFAITYCPARELWLVFRVSKRGVRARNPVAYRRSLPAAVDYAYRPPRTS